MASSIVWRRLRTMKEPLRILDPMAGSGTTVVVSRLLGHEALGFDTDPLALLIARAWSSDVNADVLRKAARRVLATATSKHPAIPLSEAYPKGADQETRAFVRFWFDAGNRRQLAALTEAISEVRDGNSRTFLWCAFSRLIITKQSGASLAMDVSHSRPHKVYRVGPIKPFKHFLNAVEAVLRGSHFARGKELPPAAVRRGDARALPVRSGTVDFVITSPPYLNAIDYLRGHKFSLVWMGHQLSEVRKLRAANVGTESAAKQSQEQEFISSAIEQMGRFGTVAPRIRGMLARYVRDMDRVLAEVGRVLKEAGQAVFVVGDSTIRGTFVKNSRCLVFLAKRNGLRLRSVRRRLLPDNRRYLPPPGRRRSGKLLRARMRQEVVLVFSKPQNATTLSSTGNADD
jgi:SAM-dependent methyltransferase